MNLPPRALRKLGGAPIVRQGRTLDAQVQLLLRLNRLVGNKPFHELGVRRARRSMDDSTAVAAGAPPSDCTVEDRILGGRPVRIYRPTAGSARPRPALIYFHGGGYVVGSLDSHDAPCRELASRTPCTVVSVDYRLAPEHPFPAAVDDGTTVFRAVVAGAEELGIDSERIAVGGDSAGGNLAAVVALDTRQDSTRPCFQLLVYPAVDMTASFPSATIMGTGFMLETASINWFRKTYLAGADPKNPRVSPLRADNHRDLPPALVITAGFDPLRDEGDAYADRLRESGVIVAHHEEAALFHGFWNVLAIVQEAERAFDRALRVLRKELYAPRSAHAAGVAAGPLEG